MDLLLATADDLAQAVDGKLGDTVAINTLWVLFAAILVLFMQAGFAMLEIGFSRMKNAGTGVAKILTNLSIAAICYWAVGFAFAFGSADVLGISSQIIGSNGFFLQFSGNGSSAFPVMGLSDATVEAKWLFQFAFCAVSLAIVWGSTLERIKYAAYVIYAIVFASLIYPIGSHWVFGGGWLQNGDTGLMPTGMQDFAGSTAVHLIGASGAFAALLLLGPRKGKYGPDGKPRAIPGHSIPLVGLGTLILFIGWFGFNPGSTLNITDTRSAEVCIVTLMGCAGGILGAFVMTQVMQRTIDIGMVANGAIAGLVAITAPSGYVEIWAGPIIGAVAGVIVVCGVIAIDKWIDDPIGATSAHGLAGIWGTLVVRPLHRASAGSVQRVRRSGRRTVLLGALHPADRPGGRRAGGVRLRVRDELPHVLAHQGHDRAARVRGRGGCRSGHRRARHVRIPGAVHHVGRGSLGGVVGSCAGHARHRHAPG